MFRLNVLNGEKLHAAYFQAFAGVDFEGVSLLLADPSLNNSPIVPDVVVDKDTNE